MSFRRTRLPAVALPLLLVLGPAEASAHVRLEWSSPARGEVVAALPTALQLVFSERVQVGLTSIVLLGPQGDTIPLGPLRLADDRRMTVLADIAATGPAGDYVIVWRTVSADGHPVSGRIPFIIEPPRADTLPAAGELPGGDTISAPAELPPASPTFEELDPPPTGFHVRSPAFVAIRWLGYLSLVGMFGAAVFLAVLLPGVTARAPHWRGPDLEAAWRARRWGVLAAIAFLLTAVARLVAQGTALAGPLGVNIDVINTIVLESAWGLAWILQVAAGFVMAAMLAGGERRWAQLGALAMVPVVAIGMGAAGHALVAPWPAAIVALHAGHLIAVGIWFGGLSMVLLAALPAARAAGAGLSPRMAAIVNGFSPLALACGAVVVLTGVLAAAVHLGGLRELWESDYGRTLAVKLLIVAAVLGLGAWNWRRMRPSLAGSADAAPLRASGGSELAFAVLVLLVTSLLVATPPPA